MHRVLSSYIVMLTFIARLEIRRRATMMTLVTTVTLIMTSMTL